MTARMTVDPELVDAGRQVDSPSVIPSRIRGNRGPENLQPGIENGRGNLRAMNVCLRLIGHLHFTQHLSVVPPQPGDAPKERPIVDATFAESLVKILARDILGA